LPDFLEIPQGGRTAGAYRQPCDPDRSTQAGLQFASGLSTGAANRCADTYARHVPCSERSLELPSTVTIDLRPQPSRQPLCRVARWCIATVSPLHLVIRPVAADFCRSSYLPAGKDNTTVAASRPRQQSQARMRLLRSKSGYGVIGHRSARIRARPSCRSVSRVKRLDGTNPSSA
jgi:hypothetical protein